MSYKSKYVAIHKYVKEWYDDLINETGKYTDDMTVVEVLDCVLEAMSNLEAKDKVSE